MQRGARVVVLDASNAEWWRVRTASDTVGFVPASFVTLVAQPNLDPYGCVSI